MRNIFFITLIILLTTSCSSNKVIEDYISNDIKNEDALVPVIYKEKVNTKYTISLLTNKFMKFKDSISIVNRTKSFNSIDINYIQKIYNDDTKTEKWNEDNFKNVEVEIIDNKFNFLKSKINKTKLENYKFYSFSKLLFNKNKKIAFFYTSKGSSTGTVFSSGIVIMKKFKGKWTIIETIDSKELN